MTLLTTIYLCLTENLPWIFIGLSLKPLQDPLFFSQNRFEAKFLHEKLLELLDAITNLFANFWLQGRLNEIEHGSTDEIVVKRPHALTSFLVVLGEKLLRQLFDLCIEDGDEAVEKITSLGSDHGLSTPTQQDQ